MNYGGKWNETEDDVAANGSIFIISENGYHDLFRALSLENEKIQVYSFRDALREFSSTRADIVIIDCVYDAAVCIDLIRGLKSMAPSSPIILLLNDSSRNIISDAFAAGARLFIRKPFNLVELRGILQRLLEFKRATTERRRPLLFCQLENPNNGTEATTDKPVNILRVIQFIERNFSEKISLESLAREANLSKYHFCRFFNRYTGMSPMKFVNLKRIERAKEFLRGHDHTVSIISMLTGFNDLGTFIRQFKNVTGLTPSDYKKTAVRGPEAIEHAGSIADTPFAK